MRTRWLLLPLLLFMVGAVAETERPLEEWSSSYDRYFKKYSKRYFGPFFDWRWFKAQAVAESGLDARAESRVGAIGVMQIMPATYKEIREKNPHIRDLETPRWNIAAGIFYDRLLFRKWQLSAEPERIYFVMASYNAGYQRVLRAAKKTEGEKKQWDRVRNKVPGQTRHYVKRIRGLMNDERRDGDQRARGRDRFSQRLG